MSAFATLDVKRHVAMAALAEIEFPGLSDGELATRLDAHLADRLNNVCVTRHGGDEAEFARIMGLDLD